MVNAPSSSTPDTAMSGAVKPPENCLSAPISDGPTKPPRLPTDTISASPPAAARPVRNPDGMAQYVAWNARTPLTVTHSAISLKTGA